MSNRENKSDSSKTSNENSSTDKGKAKTISTISNSATTLLRETLNPSNGINTITLLQQINDQKPQSSTTSNTFFLQEEWKNKNFQQENINNNYNNNYNENDIEWKQWISKDNNNNIIEPCPSAKLNNIYPINHHYPHKINILNENIKEGNEILGILNTNNYTNQVYNEDFNQITSKRQKDYNFLGNSGNIKFDLEEFLESEDIQKYLLKTSYTDDVYGIPIILKELINEAKDELNNQNVKDDNDNTLKQQSTAIERLKMVRDHLIEKRKLNNGNNDDDDKLLNNWLDEWTG
ncbi:hypothetical protein C1645_822317 [Glomus cerebriforme]|uniref:Uncharacterized protein n=1 Tax=Glomus cerebriforme TaxID=658196 RepID=A0A397T8E6_9GLOM|nr:hypothetical protein C1645_822317 [Glomus cerebriforme]